MLAPTAALDEAARLWTGLLAQAGPEALERPSGCAEWSNRDLVNHLVGGGDRYAILLRGGTAADTAATRSRDYLVGDDPVGDDPVTRFWLFENDFRVAMSAADLGAQVDHRAGCRPGRELVTMRVMEVALHAHDLAVGLDAAWEPSDALVEFLLAEAVPILDEFRDWGTVGAVTAAATDRPADRLLALAGRR